MPNRNTFPLHDLIAYRVARELFVAVAATRISNAGLRDQALRAASAVGLNIAEAVGRPSRADQRRVYGIARAEASETLAALDLAEAAGLCTPADARSGKYLAERVYALLSGLMRASKP